MKGSGTVEDLTRWPLFAALSQEHRDRLGAQARRRRLARGDVLFTRGTPADCCFGIVAGLIQLSLSNPQGLVKVVEVLGPGDTIGEAVMFLGRDFPVDATALVDTELVTIPVGVIDDLLDRDAAFARSLLASMAQRLHALVKDIEMYALQSATQRLVTYILGEMDERGALRLAPSKQVVAARLGVTPETLSRALRDLADRELVALRGRSVTVPDAAALRALLD